MNIDGESSPIDLVVDELIGHLERPDAFMRTVSGQVFTSLCSMMLPSTIDLMLEVNLYLLIRSNILTFLQQLQPHNLNEDHSMSTDETGDEENEGSDQSDDDGSRSSKKSSSDDSESEDEDDGEGTSSENEENGDVDPEFRQKIADALGNIGAQDASSSDSDDSSEIMMDDDQMMELDEKLAEVFRSHSLANKAKTGKP
jgi:DNA polymerase phi